MWRKWSANSRKPECTARQTTRIDCGPRCGEIYSAFWSSHARLYPSIIFAKILRGEFRCFMVYEDDEAFGFVDIMPRTPAHLGDLEGAGAIFSMYR
jgi:hypothetical protein